MYQPEQRTYWKRTRLIAFITLASLLVPGLFVAIFIDQLDLARFMDFPLGYFLAAQGLLFVLVILSFWYALLQGRTDREYGLLEDE